uniref:Uncharacterized protein n=1 Tax=Picea glauca TaxID=3330 RepID=A0A101LV48_PICGL|nr:hypothetical protein ABT39_MTgene2240 [Picea glauca]
MEGNWWRGIFFSLTLGWLVSLLAGRSSTFVLYSTMLRFIYVFIIRKEGQLGKSWSTRKVGSRISISEGFT